MTQYLTNSYDLYIIQHLTNSWLFHLLLFQASSSTVCSSGDRLDMSSNNLHLLTLGETRRPARSRVV